MTGTVVVVVVGGVLADRPRQGDICVTIQAARARVSAVTQAGPHAVRWDEGVRQRWLARGG